MVGLGNPQAGDDGVGWHAADRIRGHPLLPAGVDVIQSRELLTLQDELHDRSLIVVVDALLEDGPCGRLCPIRDLAELDARGGSVHHLPPAQELAFLRAAFPELRRTPLIVVGVTVQRAEVRHGLSPALARRLDTIASGVLDLLAREAARLGPDPAGAPRPAGGAP